MFRTYCLMSVNTKFTRESLPGKIVALSTWPFHKALAFSIIGATHLFLPSCRNDFREMPEGIKHRTGLSAGILAAEDGPHIDRRLAVEPCEIIGGSGYLYAGEKALDGFGIIEGQTPVAHLEQEKFEHLA